MTVCLSCPYVDSLVKGNSCRQLVRSVFFSSVRVSSVQFSSRLDGIYALGKAHMRSTPSLGSFPSAAFVKQFQRWSDGHDGPFSSSQGRSLSASSFLVFFFVVKRSDRDAGFPDEGCRTSQTLQGAEDLLPHWCVCRSCRSLLFPFGSL